MNKFGGIEDKSFIHSPKGSIIESASGTIFVKDGQSQEKKQSNMTTKYHNFSSSDGLGLSNYQSKTSSDEFFKNTSVKKDIPNDETDVNIILRKRLEGMENQLRELSHTVLDFSILADQGIKNLTDNMGQLQKNLN